LKELTLDELLEQRHGERILSVPRLVDEAGLDQLRDELSDVPGLEGLELELSPHRLGHVRDLLNRELIG
jgi:hypothetical protein